MSKVHFRSGRFLLPSQYEGDDPGYYRLVVEEDNLEGMPIIWVWQDEYHSDGGEPWNSNPVMRFDNVPEAIAFVRECDEAGYPI
jgi:hypothetical protein